MMNNMTKYIPINICKDESSHTYIISSKLVELFNRLNECDENDFELLVRFNLVFSQYRVDGYMPQLYVIEE